MHDFAKDYTNADEPTGPPGGGPKRTRIFKKGPEPKRHRASVFKSRPPPPQPSAASSSTQKPEFKMFDTTVDDDMRDTKEE